MSNINKREIILELDASYKVKHENYDSFSESYFGDIYEQASQMIKEIVDADKEDEHSSIDDYTEPISNIVAFIGKRGSGKTSAMLSFCDFLKNFCALNQSDSDSQFICKELVQMNQDIFFTVLNSIDATLIEKPEDLIGAILGNMRVVIKEQERKHIQNGKVQDSEIRKLTNKLGNIYCSLNQDMNMEDTASEVLEQLSRSWNQQQAFREAVNKFSGYIIDDRYRASRNYLVIPIDDVDMNLKNGYQLLEVIRKYLMAPNVIVILAIDYQQLDGLCRKAYRHLLCGEDKDTKAGQLATEYLEKMIPTGRKLFMPDLYAEGYTTILVENANGKQQSVKDIVLQNVWEHTGIILNKDYEIHWMQPNSLRKLSNYYNSFRYLSDYNEKTEIKEKLFHKNIDWLYEDIFRFLKDEGDEDGKAAKIIESFWSELPANKIRKLISDLRNYNFNEFIDSNNTYGNVIGVLFRTQMKGNFPAVVHGVLMVLSLYMRRLMFNLEYNTEEQENRAYVEKFSQNEFWGDCDLQILSMANSRGKVVFSSPQETKCENFLNKLYSEDEIKEGNFDVQELVMLAIQMAPQKTGDKCKSTFRFGNFVNVSFDYEQRLNEIKGIILENKNLSDKKRSEIEQEIKSIINGFKNWKDKYKTTRVIPYDSVEFMLQVFDRLYGYSGIFIEASESEDFKERYAEKYKDALSEIKNILESYDDYYKERREEFCKLSEDKVLMDLKRKYADIYGENPFVKYMQEKANGNTIIKRYIGFFERRTNTENSVKVDNTKVIENAQKE